MNLNFSSIKQKIVRVLYMPSSSGRQEFFESFALMLSSGIQVDDILNTLEAEANSRGMKFLAQDIRSEIENGNPIWYALQQAKLLPLHLLAIVQIAEESGKLNENISIVVEYLKREKEFRSKLRSASIYPAFILILLLGIGLALGLLVLPNLAKTYKNLNADLPLLTRIVIGFGEFMSVNGYIVVPALVGGIIVFGYIIFINKATKHLGQAFMLRVPIINRLIKETEIFRFGYLSSTILDAGVMLPDAMHLLSVASPYREYSRFYAKLASDIEQGLSFSESFTSIDNSQRLFPLYVRQMIVSGEKTASLEISLKKVGEVYEAKSNTTSKNISVIIEPALLIIVWVMVAIIAFAVVLPIYNLTNTISESAQSNPTIEEQNADLPSLEIVGGEDGKANIYRAIDEVKVGTVEEGTLYKYSNSENGWYEIVLQDNKRAWIEGSSISLID